MNGVGGLAAVVLMDEHRVFCDVKAGGVPVRKDGRREKSVDFFFLLFLISSLK